VVRARKGETVASIARRYKLAASAVADWNDVRTSAAFKVGQQVVVYLPVRQAAPARASAASSGGSKKASAAPARRGGTPSKVKRR
jgi:membrane-bound lytic murein transglycosylase D